MLPTTATSPYSAGIKKTTDKLQILILQVTFQELLSDADDLGCIISITNLGVVFNLSMYGSLDHDGGRGPFLQSWDVSKLLLEMVELSLFAIPLDMQTFVFALFFGSFLDFYF